MRTIEQYQTHYTSTTQLIEDAVAHLGITQIELTELLHNSNHSPAAGSFAHSL